MTKFEWIERQWDVGDILPLWDVGDILHITFFHHILHDILHDIFSSHFTTMRRRRHFTLDEDSQNTSKSFNDKYFEIFIKDCVSFLKSDSNERPLKTFDG